MWVNIEFNAHLTLKLCYPSTLTGRAPSPTRCDSPTAAANTAVNSDSGSAEPVDRVYVLAGGGSPRRCGGLGDILSGATAVSLHWALQVILMFCLHTVLIRALYV